MLNKKRAQTWVKVVAWVLAIAFALSMTMVLIPTSSNRDNSVPEDSDPRPGQTLTPTADSEKSDNLLDSALGQGDQATKNGQIDQAIVFYEKAYELDKNNKKAKLRLADAYYAQAKLVMSTNTTEAKTLFNKYLKLSPDGPFTEEAESALRELK